MEWLWKSMLLSLKIGIGGFIWTLIISIVICIVVLIVYYLKNKKGEY